jgi:hypothetical protein
MQRDRLSFINPNRLHGCHPLDLRAYFEDSHLIHNIDNTFPLATTKPEISAPPICKRRRALDRIINRISQSEK